MPAEGSRDSAAGQPALPPQRRRRGARLLAWAAVGTDVVCIVAAVLAAYYTRASLGPPLLAPLAHPLRVYLLPLPVVIVLLLLTGRAMGLYRSRLPELETQVVGVLRTTSLGTLLLAGASFLSHFDYSRAMLLLFWAYLTAFELGGRALLTWVRQRQLIGELPVRALIVGTGDLANLVSHKLAHAPAPGYECLGYVAADEEGWGDVLGPLGELPRLVRELGVEEVFVAAPELKAERLMPVVDECDVEGLHFYLVAGPLQVLTGESALAELSRLPVIELPGPYSPSPFYLASKRLLDIVGSLLALVLLGPLMLVLALLIRRQTGASALFVQERVGQRGRPFAMYKFRTMYPDTPAYAPAPASDEDPRVTPVGRWLRRYSLDELPQLFNVLRGEMSLVGPRPEMPFIVERYAPWQRRRLEAKPGITGLWQIMGRKDLPLAENIEYDFYYLRHQSLLLDLEILLRTIPVVLSARGAY
ncbi:MAG: sugar transferase [Armatimonadetes bacterium]|nr:sugar transferase [Armatimonadota bacterium]